MNTAARYLKTRKGDITFPAYIPVTTFGKKYPLDGLIRPYLSRIAPAVMVSFHYAKQQQATDALSIPMMVDSGGFASLFANAKVVKRKGLGVIVFKGEEGTSETTPYDVIETQESIADIAFTLDFPIPPGTEKKETTKRFDLTVANAMWATDNRRRRDMPLYACIQAWDKQSAKECARAYSKQKFDGVAIGGLVPRSSNLDLIKEIVEGVKEEIGHLPVHVFGLGKPSTVELLFSMGVDTVDSSSYVKLAAEGKLWGNRQQKMIEASPTERLHLALSNLAFATQKTLPLSTAPLFFSISKNRQNSSV